MYYDSKGRLIQTKSTNHLGGVDEEYIAYNFMGQPVKRKHVHMATGKNTQTEVYAYSYDHAGRLLKTTHQLTDGTSVKPTATLAENNYDELGRLKTNKKGGQANLNTTYTYNVRSWTKTISSPLFSQTLYYFDPITNNVPYYNGNISAIGWRVSGDDSRTYRFKYDNLSRLIHAAYNNVPSGGLYNTSYSYDKHGNIKTTIRNGKNDAGVHTVADNLTMNYNGNQLLKVTDTGNKVNMSNSADFKDYSNVATEYTYNTNGAMTKDLNKGISQIQYNSLNLPRQMDIKSPVAEARNEYTYSAGGQKLKVVQKWNPNFSTSPVIGSAISTTSLTKTKTTDYVGNMVYEDGTLKRVLVDGGYIENNVYHYYQNDHLGNNRVVANASGTVIQKNHYYPFGMAFAEGTVQEQGKQPYKYNGKELDQMHGLNMYDYSARYYEPAIGRFTTVDPLAEKFYSWSPYAYCYNNPIKFVDPDGEFPIIPILIILGKGTAGALIDAGAQIAVGMANGKNFTDAAKNVDLTSVATSFVTSAFTAPGASTGTKAAIIGVNAVDALVDVKANGETASVFGAIGDEKPLSNIVLDAASSYVPGKIADDMTSGFNKAVTSDLKSNAAATLTKNTKETLKQAKNTVNGTGFQTTLNLTTDLAGKLVGGQANEIISNKNNKSVKRTYQNNSIVQPSDATKVAKQPMNPLILQKR